MKKIIEKIERFLCGISSDKWVHIVVSLVLTFLIGQGIYLFSGYDLPSCGDGSRGHLCARRCEGGV